VVVPARWARRWSLARRTARTSIVPARFERPPARTASPSAIPTVATVSATVGIADGLAVLADGRSTRAGTIDVRAVRRARDHLRAHLAGTTTAVELEQVTGLDRYTLVRQFRAVHGTTPDRYRMLRRLDLARAAIARGRSLADAAAESGFADQSHLTRQFRRAFGMTPGRWRAANRSDVRGAEP